MSETNLKGLLNVWWLDLLKTKRRKIYIEKIKNNQLILLTT